MHGGRESRAAPVASTFVDVTHARLHLLLLALAASWKEAVRFAAARHPFFTCNKLFATCLLSNMNSRLYHNRTITQKQKTKTKKATLISKKTRDAPRRLVSATTMAKPAAHVRKCFTSLQPRRQSASPTTNEMHLVARQHAQPERGINKQNNKDAVR